MIVSRAKPTDMSDVLEMSKEMHAEGYYSYLPFVDEKVAVAFVQAITDPSKAFWIARNTEGKPCGMIAGVVTSFSFCHDKRVSDLVFFVRKAHRGGSAAIRLLSVYLDWGKSQMVRDIGLSTTTGVNPEAAARLLEKAGLHQVGGVFRARVV